MFSPNVGFINLMSFMLVSFKWPMRHTAFNVWFGCICNASRCTRRYNGEICVLRLCLKFLYFSFLLLFFIFLFFGCHILILCYILKFSSLLQRYCSYTIFCECILCVVWFLFNFLQCLCDCCAIVLSIWSCRCVRICKCHHGHCFVWHSSNM